MCAGCVDLTWYQVWMISVKCVQPISWWYPGRVVWEKSNQSTARSHAKIGYFDVRSSTYRSDELIIIRSQRKFKAELFTLVTRNLVETTPLSNANVPLGSIKKMDLFTTNGLHFTISEFVTGLILLLKTILQQQNQYWSSVNVSRLHDLQWIGSNEMNCDTQKNQEVLLTEEEMK